MPILSLFATCAKSIEDLLVQELSDAGALEAKETVAGARFRGDLATAYRICMWSRFASRILLPVAELPAASPEELLDGVRSIPWNEHFGTDQTFAVDASCSTSAIRHADYAALVVKDGIADYFRAREGRRPNVLPRNPDIRISLRLLRDVATVSIELSGGSLHRRGYRTRGVAAPLKENVAAAMLARARWPEIAAAGGPLVDPMCGSGTLLIEGAMMAGDIAPGLLRAAIDERQRSHDGIAGVARRVAAASAASSRGGASDRGDFDLPQKWRGNNADVWRAVVREAAERCAVGISRMPAVFGFDRDAAAVAAAAANVAACGLGGKIAVTRGELGKLVAPPGRPGLLAVNPPYGERIGSEGGIEALYRDLGAILHDRFPGWRACILTSDLGLSRSVGLRASKTNTLFNGPIRCVLAQFEITEDNRYLPGEGDRARARPDGTAGADALAGGDDAARGKMHNGVAAGRGEKAEAKPAGQPPRRTGEGRSSKEVTGGIISFINRVRKNRKVLDRWAKRNEISCYRVYDADLPEYAVAIDIFEDRWLHVQEYVAPRSVDADKAAERLEDIVTVLPETVGVAQENIFLKRRKRRKRTEQYTKMAATGEFYEVHEGGCTFLANFTDYLDAGLFLDHRLTRQLIRSAASGRRFLNLFAYTATATVFAVRGGAVSSTSIDSSNTYLRWARENLTANGIAGQQHQLVRADCWEWLHVDRGQYDLIFMDPPTFSNAKGKRATLDVQRDHPKLIRLAADRLAPGGQLLFSTNFRRFSLERTELSEFTIEDITAETIPRDFARNRRIHSCFRIEKP